VLSLPFAVIVAFRPVLRRLAFGHIARRPRETALVLLGSLLGTAIITGSFVVGDTLDASVGRGIYTKLGPIDVVASTPDDPATLERALTTLPPTVADGVLPLTDAGVAVATTGPKPLAEPTAQLVEVDFGRASSFGGDRKATGIVGATPRAGEAVVGADLAKTLHLRIGDEVRVYAYGADRTLRVVRTLPRWGVAGFDRRSVGSRSPTIFVAPGLVESMAATGPVHGEPPQHLVAVSQTGGVADHASDTNALERAVYTAARDAGVRVNVVDVKERLHGAARAVGDAFTQLFGMIGLFAVLAGVLLLVNIFVMLAQERQSELGMLRAVGLRRAGLVGSFSLEGWLYALGSSVLGTVAGLGVGRVIVIVATNLFGRGPGGAQSAGLELVFSPERGSLRLGFLIGFVISMVTVLATSASIARLNVIRAIRELPKPTVTRTRPVLLVLGALLASAGALVTAAAVANAQPAMILVGPCLLAVGVVPLTGREPRRRRALLSVDTGALLVWAIAAFALFPGAFRDAKIAIFVVQGVILVASGVALLSLNQELIGAAIRRVGGGARSTALRLGLAYPLARRFRTGMTLAMYALVVYMLATITIFSHLFGGQVDEFTRSVSGGFDLVVTTNPTNPAPAEGVRSFPGVDRVAAISEVSAEWTPADPRPGGRRVTGTVAWPAGSFDASFVAEQAPKLAKRPPRYATDADAYRAVLADPSLFIPTGFFLERGGGPPSPPSIGERYVLRDPVSGRSRTLTVAAVAEAGFGNLRPLMAPDALRSVFGPRAVPNVFYVHTKANVDPAAVATRVNGAFVANGADARSFAHIVAENLSQQQGFFRLMRGYLALGLVVGIAGLGVVMVRSVRERRREVGVLRALGFEPAAVRRAFVVESAFVAVEGILTGTLLAVVTTWRLAGNADFGATLHYRVPVAALALLVVATIVASLVATAAPAQQASKIRPAVALRIAD
jgi:putative ABC transport system permease protein